MRARLTRQGKAERAAEKLVQALDHSARPIGEARDNLGRQSEEARREAQELRTEAQIAEFEARLAELDVQKAEREARQLTLEARQGNMEGEIRGSPRTQQPRNNVTPQARHVESVSQRRTPDVEDEGAGRPRHVRPSPKSRRPRRTTPESNHVAEQDRQATSDPCPFCDICKAYRRTHQWNEWRQLDQAMQPDLTNPPSYVVYSGEHVMAFLDRSPLTYGHTLVIPRVHKARMGDLDSIDGAELGRHLPLITRAVMRAVFDRDYNPGNLEVEGADYNIVQNNGPLAHQVVPHIHYHIIPRSTTPDPRYEHSHNLSPAPLPEVSADYHVAWTMFGRGHRSSLEDDPRVPALVKRMRNEIIKEFGRMELQGSYQQGF